MASSKSFEPIEEVLDLNIELIEELYLLDVKSLEPEARKLLNAQLKKTIGILGNFVLNDK